MKLCIELTDTEAIDFYFWIVGMQTKLKKSYPNYKVVEKIKKEYLRQSNNSVLDNAYWANDDSNGEYDKRRAGEIVRETLK